MPQEAKNHNFDLDIAKILEELANERVPYQIPFNVSTISLKGKKCFSDGIRIYTNNIQIKDKLHYCNSISNAMALPTLKLTFKFNYQPFLLVELTGTSDLCH